ncbi:hypothetical protein FISHEDRAFT_68802 [Fistulina hepatica ATCC 64428]|uniref:Ubiquitin-like protease family profile domain-containing protein n=1 Tax=Fistulina hepatica ATCC 64428 TaxID=1128425 RepID=A0A0D7AP94_9AGAR|nr:hypothetical protein FISHEDRAFT_68802 [Fistulina hepatica ATCC 64428]
MSLSIDHSPLFQAIPSWVFEKNILPSATTSVSAIISSRPQFTYAQVSNINLIDNPSLFNSHPSPLQLASASVLQTLAVPIFSDVETLVTRAIGALQDKKDEQLTFPYATSLSAGLGHSNELRLPVWVIAIWYNAHQLWGSHQSCIPWKVTCGQDCGWTLDLHKYFSNCWLNDDEISQHIAVLRDLLGLTSRVALMNAISSHQLIKLCRFTPCNSNGRPTTSLPRKMSKILTDLVSGAAYDYLGLIVGVQVSGPRDAPVASILAHEDSINHWVAVLIDACSMTMKYADSLFYPIPSELDASVQWWWNIHAPSPILPLAHSYLSGSHHSSHDGITPTGRHRHHQLCARYKFVFTSMPHRVGNCPGISTTFYPLLPLPSICNDVSTVPTNQVTVLVEPQSTSSDHARKPGFALKHPPQTAIQLQHAKTARKASKVPPPRAPPVVAAPVKRKRKTLHAFAGFEVGTKADTEISDPSYSDSKAGEDTDVMPSDNDDNGNDAPGIWPATE